MSQSEQINELSTAMAKAQAEIDNATYNRVNPHFKNKYADLAAIFDAVRKPLAKQGLWISQIMDFIHHGDGTDTQCLFTTLHHNSGQWIRSVYPLPTGVQPQAFGSALTYARRYSLSAIVGIAADEDDDANEAQQAHKPSLQAQLKEAVEKAKVVPLSEAEKEDLRYYAKELDDDRMQRFLGWLNVKSLDEIGKHQYDRALNGLKKAVGEVI